MSVLKTTKIWVYATSNDVDRLAKLCAEWKTDRSTVIRTLIREGLDREERNRQDTESNSENRFGAVVSPFLGDEYEPRSGNGQT